MPISPSCALRHLIPYALLFLAILPSAGAGQVLVSTAPGTRIRVDLSSTERSLLGRERPQSLIGTLVALRADTVLLTVRDGTDPLHIPLASTRATYVSRGRPARWRAALRGALIQAVTGAALSAVSSVVHQGDGEHPPMQMIAFSAAWGAASGAIYGAWSPRERWRRLEHPTEVINP